MPLGTPYVGDSTPTANGRVVSQVSDAQLAASFGSSVKKATAHFAIVYRGHALSYTKGQTFVADAGLLAALTAINAPVI